MITDRSPEQKIPRSANSARGSEEWVFEDEGYSGATLERPGLERVRDLAAEGQIDAVLVYA
ncbi:MAG TPA: recombinase family protein, partial [Aestuariivirgaceae bacterium]|nr:recombinase family protein [Aestuariivirgaceae bacterium]